MHLKNVIWCFGWSYPLPVPLCQFPPEIGRQDADGWVLTPPAVVGCWGVQPHLHPIPSVPLASDPLCSQDTRLKWEDPPPEFHIQWNHPPVWGWPEASCLLFLLLLPHPRSAQSVGWRGGAARMLLSPGMWEVASSAGELWVQTGDHLLWGCRKKSWLERERRQQWGGSLTLWELNCLCGGGADAPEHYLQGFNAQIKFILKCLQSLQEILMFT